MLSDSSSDLKADIGHVLFIDIAGYSKLLINEQSELLEHLKGMVRWLGTSTGCRGGRETDPARDRRWDGVGLS